MRPAPFHGAKVALFVGGRLVVIRRDDDPRIPFPGLWDFPGGGREGDETPHETAIREVREETGLDLSAAVWLHAARHPREAGGTVWFLAARLPGKAGSALRLGDEGTDLRLMTRAGVLALPDLVPHLRARLAALPGGGAGPLP